MTNVWRPLLKCKVYIRTISPFGNIYSLLSIVYSLDVLKKRLDVLHLSKLLHSYKNHLQAVPSQHPSNNYHNSQLIVLSDVVEESPTTMVIGYKMRIRKPMNSRCNINPKSRQFVIPCIGLDYLCHLHYEHPRIILKQASKSWWIFITHTFILIHMNVSSHSATRWASQLYPWPWCPRTRISTIREAETKATRPWLDNQWWILLLAMVDAKGKRNKEKTIRLLTSCNG